jgi:SAM-dependent methyltransferase
MVPTLRAFLDEWIPRAFAERPDDVAPWFYDYFGDLTGSEAERKRYARALVLDLELARFDPRGRTVVDAGSGFGVTLASFAALGGRAVGLEAFRPMALSAGALSRRYFPDLPVATLRADVRRIPLADASVDFVYCNEALSHFLEPHRFVAEAGRVIRPGGKLMVCDGNNGANPRTAAEVREVWRAFEEGPGHRTLHGHRIEVPYRERRAALIGDALPGLEASVVERLATGTFGLHGEEVVRAARQEMAAPGTLPGPPTYERCPVDPDKGDHIENLVYPDRLRAQMEEAGFAVKVYAHFGGAKGPLVAAANRVLRALTPLTLSRARSVKVVATRR